MLPFLIKKYAKNEKKCLHFIFDVILRMSSKRCGYSSGVERNLAKVDVVGPNPIARSNNAKRPPKGGLFCVIRRSGIRTHEKVVRLQAKARRQYRGRFSDERSERSVSEVIPLPAPITKSHLYGGFLLLKQTMGKRNREGSGIEQSEMSKHCRRQSPIHPIAFMVFFLKA